MEELFKSHMAIVLLSFWVIACQEECGAGVSVKECQATPMY